ncbi:MAG: diphthine synthase [Candidatus Aenigmatarchaeota archaeon]
MLYLVGLGLCDERDLTIRAIDTIKNCDQVFCEFYTNKWLGNINKLEKITKKKIKILERKEVESEFLINEAKEKNIALLVPGDPLAATTHIELILEAKKNKIKTEIIHSSSIYTAIAESGLQLYKFGRSTTLVYPEEKFKPESPYDVIEKNKSIGLHTLVLLDIKYEQNKYMTPNEGLEILLNLEYKKKKNVINENSKVVICCRIGDENQIIKYDKIKNLIKNRNINKIPAVIIIPGELNFKEEEVLEMWK